jgi:transketolase
MFAAHCKLDNLVAIIDRNELCIMGKTEELLELGDLEDKWRSFGWHSCTVDGHSFDELMSAFDRIGRTDGKPLAIIANTVKGKGISFMEGRFEWHNRMPSDEQIAQARIELGMES